MIGLSRLVFVVGLAASPLMAQEAVFSAKEIDAAPACGDARGLGEGDTLLCSCEAGTMSGSVWGSDVYTSDSSVCAAALHANAVTSGGGAVVLMGVAGQESYSGSERNGIMTRDWGSYGSSFVIAAASSGTALAQCGVLPSDADRLSCQCPAAVGNTGSVWGYGPYTSDSDICSAARHEGVIDSEGGAVTVMRVQGLENYSGGTSNGVTTSPWSSYGSSIIFDWNTP